jgi:hypothetical protein
MSANAKRGGCPICGRPPEPGFRPFCSKRCADVDLGRWLGERYVVTEPIEPERAPGLPANEDSDEA